MQQHRRPPKHKITTPEEIQVAEIRRKQKEREGNRKVRERLKAAPNITSASRNVLESDPIYPHGKLKTLKGIDGYLLTLQYENPSQFRQGAWRVTWRNLLAAARKRPRFDLTAC